MDITKSFPLVKLLVLGICFTSQITSCKEKEKLQNINVNTTSDILELEKTITLQGVTGRIDHMAIDVKNQILFIAAISNNSVESVDLINGKRINSIKDIDEPQGVVFVPENNTICVSSGGSGDCNFYDTKTFSLGNSVKLGTDADNMRYDVSTKLIFAGYGDGGIAVIDALKQNITSTISFKGHPEAFQFDANTSRIYVNVPTEKKVITIDFKSSSVVDNWQIENAGSNFPIALDENHHRLFTGCRKPSVMIVFDTELKKEVTRFDIRGDADDIFYDNEKKILYVSCGEGYIQVFKQEDKDTYKLIQEINTSKGARTSLFAPELAKIYLAVPQSESNEAAIWIYKIHNE
jgi:hypothetical protein